MATPVPPGPPATPDVRLIAFYLPQFHPIPENDAAWGDGFTEWTNVTRATPLFEGHHQPQLPAEMGFYDLRVPGVMARQAALARSHGIHGFCFYAYWFDGRRLLEKPVEALLASGDPDFPFCLCWANENWTRRWDGSEHEVIVAQTFAPEMRTRIIDDFLPCFRDPRYIRIDGKAVFIVYRPDIVPDLRQTLADWRAHAAAQGVELYLVGCLTFGYADPLRDGFDAGLEFPPHGVAAPDVAAEVAWTRPFHGHAYRYADVVRSEIGRRERGFPALRSAMVSWDNTARRGDRAHIFLDATPDLFATWLSALVHRTRLLDPPGRRMVFINAWNEWAEGAHLEPDRRFGRRWLQACAAALPPGGEAGEGEVAALLEEIAAAARAPGADPLLRRAHAALERAHLGGQGAAAAARAFALHATQRMRAEATLNQRAPLPMPADGQFDPTPRAPELLGWIDNPVANLVAGNRHDGLYVSGWALHPALGSRFEAPLLALLTPPGSDTPHLMVPLTAGLPRPDVAGDLGAALPAAEAAGFAGTIDIRDLAPGAWTLAVGSVSARGTSHLPAARRVVIG